MTLPPVADTVAPYLRALGRVMARITADADRAGVPHALAAGLVEEFDVDFADIWLYDPAAGMLHRRAHAQRSDAPFDRFASVSPSDDDLPVVRVVRDRLPLVIDDLERAYDFDGLEIALGLGLRAYAGFPLVVGDRLCGAVSMLRRVPFDAALVEALNALAQQAALALDHARVVEESRSLQALATELASARDPGALLDRLVERMTDAVGADACVVWLFEDAERLAPRAARGFSAGFFERVAHYTAAPGAFTDLRRDQAPLHFPDLPAVIRRRDPAAADVYAAEGIVSSLRLPLFAPGDQLIGLLALYHRRERRYSDDEIRLAQAFADQISVALHNARLSEEERRARATAARQLERLTTLTQITRRLLAATDLDAVLQVVVEAARRLCETTGAMVGLIDDERRHINAVANTGEPRAFFEQFKRPVLDDAYLAGTATGHALAEGRAIAVEDYASWRGGHPLSAETVGLGVRAFVVAPLLVDGAPIGVLWVNDASVRSFSADDVALVQALADHAALAIEHARLQARGEEAAVLEERARVARDLHDSVTQSVFSVGLMTNAALGQHERGLPVADTLRRIKAVSQGALSEMRALLYELHPTALAHEGLVKAIEKLVAAMQVRVDVPIRFTAETERRLSPEAETAIFRIVQEALGNATKYAEASAIDVTLAETEDRLRATVTDDGVGFDPAARVTPSADGRRGGMGMRSMRERAAAAGLSLRVESRPGAGTTIVVEAPIG